MEHPLRRRTCRAMVVGAACAMLAGMAPAEPAATGAGEWDFTVLLDDKPIGRHRFVLTDGGALRTLTSEADFSVKLLGLTVYRYRHRATERWRGACLDALSADTDDNGSRSHVEAGPEADGLRIAVEPAPTASAPSAYAGCLMSFAYWNPAMKTQTRLLNAQTGLIEAVQIARTGAGFLPVAGRTVAARAYRISGIARPVDVWYTEQGDWIGLDAVVAGGRVLSYRLR